MAAATQVKLLTLLNVSAIKKPRSLDQPGGFRSSPSLSRTASPAVTTNGTNGHDAIGVSNGTSGTPKSKGKKSRKSAGAAEGDTRPVKRRKSVVFGGEVGPSGSTFGKSKAELKGKGKAKETGGDDITDGASDEEIDDVEMEEEAESDDEGDAIVDDNFVAHFGPSPEILNDQAIASASGNEWETTRKPLKGYGKVVELSPKASTSASNEEKKNRITPSLLARLKEHGGDALVNTALAHLGTYKDLYVHSLDGEADGTETKLFGEKKEAMRKAAMVHAMNHVLKTRKRIIRNNEKLAKDPSIDPPRDTSFTRPKVLLLVPLRSLALHYLTEHLLPLAPTGTQIENLKPFTSSFTIPSDVTDPLSTPQASSSYPVDHLVNFRGNSDDNFRFGIKITRKAWRIVMPPASESKLMDCDIIIASPLGVRTAAEKEGSTDLLSSIEVALVDGLDVMQMQNWEHVQFVFDNLNKIPDNPHGCDFSRVKPWYLDNQAKYLRQTLLLSRYDSPEGRALFHRQCHNVQGKLRLEQIEFPGIVGQVRSGVRQVFERIDMEGPKGAAGAVDEVEQRLEWFTKKTLPALLKSAVMRQNTMIIVPSYFDFVRLHNHLRKSEKVSYAAISEYSSNAEISKARTLFFKGKKHFLLVTERFHFYRRYKIRGAKTLVFYSLPEHAQFYSEFMQTPFLPGKNGQGEEVEVDEAEVVARVLISRFDVLKLERVVGSNDARRMLSSGEGRFEFV